MIGTTALVTDSNAQLPPELADRFGVEVVPITVVVDGVAYAEGVDLDADGFYARFAGGRLPDVSTSQPSPAAFAAAYERAAAAGAEHVLSVHISGALSGTLNSARSAAEASPIPVRLVDTGTASFGIACCVWQAAEALVAGVDVDAAAEVAGRTASTVGNVFVVQAPELAARGGRILVDDIGDDIGVLSLVDGKVEVVATAADLDAAAVAMAHHVLAAAADLAVPVRVAVGVADAAGAPLSDALHDLVAASGLVDDVVRYRVGPSVGVHTGPGTAGAFWFPTTT